MWGRTSVFGLLEAYYFTCLFEVGTGQAPSPAVLMLQNKALRSIHMYTSNLCASYQANDASDCCISQQPKAQLQSSQSSH